MNKPYFAKYLPVEGEIKQGDLILDPNSYIYKCTRIDNLFLNCSGYNGLVKISSCKKVKLFLCSRDIQVGDKIKADYYVGKGTYLECRFEKEGEVLDNNNFIDHYQIKTILGLEFALKTGCFKIIGEISSEAAWVKEGDEFEESEVNRQCYDDSGSLENPWFDYFDVDDMQSWSEYEAKYKRIQIKCPCCNKFV